MSKKRVANDSMLSIGFSFCMNSGRIKFRDSEQRLSPTNMKILFCLLKNSETVVSRAEIFDIVWPNQEISDDTLTRALSDIRTSLKNMSGRNDLIETYPKRGYCWMHAIDVNCELIENAPSYPRKIKNEMEKSNTSRYGSLLTVSTWLVGGLLALWFMSMVVLWSLHKLIQPDLVRVAVIPMQIERDEDANLRLRLNEVLKRAILKTDKIRYLSDLTSQSGGGKPYPYLSREFAAQWVIEVQLKKNNQNVKFTLTLVDAKTAIVYDTLSTNAKNKPEELSSFVDEFVALIPVRID